MRYNCILILVLLLSCKTTKRLGPLPERTLSEIVHALKNRNIAFEWVSAKASIAFESPDEKVSGSLALRMKKDSVIWLTIKKFGYEFARVMADKEKYTVLYRLESAYETFPISKINNMIALSADFEDAQQLMFGNTILPDENNTKIEKDSIYYVLNTHVDNMELTYYVNGYTLELDKMTATDSYHRKATVYYSDYRTIPKYGKMAYKRTYEYPYSTSTTASVTLDFSEIEINVPKEIPFVIPDHYEKIN
jgi:hypothetical protein